MLRVAAVLLLVTAAPGFARKASADPADAAERASDVGSKMVCKRFAETGSLVSTYRQCKTKRDWERARDNGGNMNASGACATAAEGTPCVGG